MIPTLGHAVSGASGSLVAISLFYPLDALRTRLQVQEVSDAHRSLSIARQLYAMWKSGGALGLYKGWWSTAIAASLSYFVYFYCFHGLKAYISDQKGKSSSLIDLWIGIIAGSINVITTTPLWVVNTRLKVQEKASPQQRGRHSQKLYTGFFNCLMRIANEEGTEGLWSGTWPSLLLVGNPSIQFMVYYALKRYLAKYESRDATGYLRVLIDNKNSPVAHFLMGALAKMVATLLTYPLQVVQCRMRAKRIVPAKLDKESEGKGEINNALDGTSLRKRAGKEGEDSNNTKNLEQKGKAMSPPTVTDVLRDLIKSHGMQGLFLGIKAKLLQTVLTSSVMFMCYERFVQILVSSVSNK